MVSPSNKLSLSTFELIITFSITTVANATIARGAVLLATVLADMNDTSFNLSCTAWQKNSGLNSPLDECFLDEGTCVIALGITEGVVSLVSPAKKALLASGSTLPFALSLAANGLLKWAASASAIPLFFSNTFKVRHIA